MSLYPDRPNYACLIKANHNVFAPPFEVIELVVLVKLFGHKYLTSRQKLLLDF